jgi:phosphoglycerate dehydrogenase-like enzyme
VEPIRIAILDDYQGVALTLADWASLGPNCDVVSFDRHVGEAGEAATALADFDILCLMRERMHLTRAHFAALPRLKLVVVTGSRERCIDHAAARDYGVTVQLTGGSANNGPAELTFALILAAAHRIPQEDRHLRGGGWQEGVGMLLEGRVLGVLGLGRIGQKIAALGQAFGMTPIAWSPNLTAERAAAAGVAYRPREQFFGEADVISVHMVLSDSTRHLIGAAELALMKRTALLINTSRGGLIREAALIEALRERRIGGAALDVYETEPLPAGHPLLALENTVLTPHIGFVNDTTYRMHYARTVSTIADWLAEQRAEAGS